MSRYPDHRVTLAAAFLLILALGPSCATAMSLGEEGQLQKTVWQDKESGIPRFLPENVLADPRPSTAGKGQPDLADTTVKRALMEFGRQAAFYPDCAEPPTAEVVSLQSEPPAATRSIQTLVSTADTAMIGKVRSVTAGWGIPDKRVLSLIEVVVEFVLTPSPLRPFAPGDRITYVQNSGQLRIGQKLACSNDYPGFAAVRPGENVLLIGVVNRHDPDHVNRHFVFPIRDGTVVPQPYPRVSNEPVATNFLRSRGAS